MRLYEFEAKKLLAKHGVRLPEGGSAETADEAARLAADIGGPVALMFFLIFAQSIFGSKTTHSQIERLLSETEQMNELLRQIAQSLEKEGANPRKERQQSPADEEKTEG